MGLRNPYVDRSTRRPTSPYAAWVGPDQGTNSTDVGARPRPRTRPRSTRAGNYGWPYCTGNQQGYRAKLLPANHRRRPRPRPATPARVGSGTTAGNGGGYWDCDDPHGIVNDSPYNTGLEGSRQGAATNIWYGLQGGCYDFPRNANGVLRIYNGTRTRPPTRHAYRRCPFVFGGSRAPMTAGTTASRPGEAPDAWPAYWDGRWFLATTPAATTSARAADGPGDGVHGRPADRGGLAVRDHPDVA